MARARATWAAARRPSRSARPWPTLWRRLPASFRIGAVFMQSASAVDLRRLLFASFRAAIAAADPLQVLPASLPDVATISGIRRTLAVGAGKAAASMAMAVERHWPAEAPLEGLVVTRYAHGLPCRRIEVIEAGHPVPDEAGESAAARILDRAASLGDADLMVALVSGGGSSLLSLPV